MFTQGAPTPVTAYLSVGSKAAGFIVLLRVLEPFLILPRMRTCACCDRRSSRSSTAICGAAAGECLKPASCLLKYCPRRLSTRSGSLVFRARRCFLSRRLSLDDGCSVLLCWFSLARPEVINWKGFAGLSQRSPFLAFGHGSSRWPRSRACLSPPAFYGKFLVFDAAVSCSPFRARCRRPSSPSAPASTITSK